MSLEDAPQRFSEAICAQGARCGTSPLLGFDFSSDADCESTYGAFYRDFFLVIEEQVDEGAVEYVPDAAEDCLAYLNECGPQPVESASCMSMMVLGQLGVGESCQADLQCAPGSYCDLDRTTCEGECRASAGVGDACGGASPDCGEDSYCDFQTDTCMALRAEGEACMWGRECGYLACASVQAGATDMRCTPVRDLIEANLAEGAACSKDSGFCAEGLFCIVQDGEEVGTCEKPFARDAACVEAVPDACPVDQFCDPDTGTCTDRLAQGEPCDSPLSCGPGLLCDDDRCRKVFSRSVGESCQADAECTSAKCEGGVCVSLLNCTPR